MNGFNLNKVVMLLHFSLEGHIVKEDVKNTVYYMHVYIHVS